MTTEATEPTNATVTLERVHEDPHCQRLAIAFERLAHAVSERPDLAGITSYERGLTLAEHVEELADWAARAAKENPSP